MDIIFCRNVLMYFAPERFRRIGQSLYCSLVEGGWLIVGASELSQILFPQFAAVHFPGAIVYRKGPEVPQPALAFPIETILAQETFIPERLKPAAKVEWFAPPVEHSTSDTMPTIEIPTPAETQEEVPNAIALSVRALANQGHLSDALALCEKAIAAYKLDTGLHYLHATILQELNRDGEAIASLKRALYLEPDFVLAHFALGNLAMRQGDVRTGKRCFENVLALLSARPEEDILPESEGLTAGRFREIIHATLQIGAST
jgi:chemotaxis protein methyltransferase CheR